MTTATTAGKRKIFKYNLSFYYQSTIIYFIAFLLYVFIKGMFLEDSFKMILKDPVIYFFILIVLIALISLLYNLYLNKHIEFRADELVIKKGSRTRVVKYSDIVSIRQRKERRRSRVRSFRIIRIKVRNRRLPIIIIPYDYENRMELIEAIKELRNKFGNKSNV
ncbi:MAG: hypothetical protein HF300_02300 [Ignavibacteria bacterium]|jgi:hypothetical protein|nr:hypothetical protein [Ignavibacteria bacterium]MCU7511357.1 hypothetical protein [Ignavibacteria bacterium]MCU7523428.1 hypothetical protein [Ignavibacteria bacterium]